MLEGWDAYAGFREALIAIDPARYPAEWIDGRVKDRRYRCWSDGNAAILAEIKAYPSGLKEVQGVAAAGELESIVALIPYAEEWGRKRGCAGAEIASKPAWAKIMEQRGYRPAVVRLWKEF